MMKRVVLIGLCALLAGCGHHADTTAINPPPPPPPPPLNTPGSVTINDSGYVPANISITVGQTVHWSNQGTTTHTVTSDNGVFDSGTLSPPVGSTTPGGTYSLAFANAGTYGYHCTLHPNMTGTITVTR